MPSSRWLLMLPVLALGFQPAPQAPPQRPAFTSTTVLVPVVVRAMDNRTGKPVTDLQQEDFTLLEDGALQPIRHFERRGFAPDPAPVPATRPALRESALGLSPQNNRIFLLVLGRGRLQEPSKALDALQRFIREQLLPQDQVAVLAYDRASDFTTDHEKIALFIDRFKKDHYQIDMDVRLAIESDLAGIYGSKALPKKTRDRIDSMFTGSGLMASRQMSKDVNPSTERAEADVARQTNRAISAELRKGDEKMDAAAALAGDSTAIARSWTTLDEVRGAALCEPRARRLRPDHRAVAAGSRHLLRRHRVPAPPGRRQAPGVRHRAGPEPAATRGRHGPRQGGQ